MANQTLDLRILSLDPNFYANKRLLIESKKLRIQTEILDPINLHIILNPHHISIVNSQQQEVAPAKYFLPRMTLSHREQILQVSKTLEAYTLKKVIHSHQSLALTSHKWNYYQELLKHDLPILKTSWSSPLASISDLENLKLSIKNKRILKLNEGAQGQGVCLTDKQTIRSNLSLYKKLNQNFLQQQYLKGPIIRTFFTAEKVIAAIQSIPANNDFRSNSHQGGKFKRKKVSAEMTYLTYKVASLFKLRFFAIDFILHKEQLVILDINSSPGFQAFEEITNLNVARLFLESEIL